MPGEPTEPLVVHASAVSVGHRGLLILGASGAGKSTLALQLIGQGAELVSDDRVCLRPDTKGAVQMAPPEPLEGLVEGRGMGLLRSPHRIAALHAVVDLDEVEQDRLPSPDSATFCGLTVPRLRKVESPAFPTMLLLFLKGGRAAP